jgi:hypothetical protein
MEGRSMRANLLWLKHVAGIGFIFMMGAGMAANAGLFGFGGTSWKEEVLQHDGSKIIVERTAKRHGRHEIGQRPPIGDQSISFTMPETGQRINWEDKYSKDVDGANFNLMALDIVHGMVYLVVTPAGCLSYNKWGRPNPPYVIFKYQGNAWSRIPLQELPAEIKFPNVLHSSPDEVAEKTKRDGIVSAEVIKSENEGFRQSEFKTILREAVKDGGITSCEHMVHYKCGWFGANPDGTFNKKFADRMCNK